MPQKMTDKNEIADVIERVIWIAISPDHDELNRQDRDDLTFVKQYVESLRSDRKLLEKLEAQH